MSIVHVEGPPIRIVNRFEGKLPPFIAGLAALALVAVVALIVAVIMAQSGNTAPSAASGTTQGVIQRLNFTSPHPDSQVSIVLQGDPNHVYQQRGYLDPEALVAVVGAHVSLRWQESTENDGIRVITSYDDLDLQLPRKGQK